MLKTIVTPLLAHDFYGSGMWEGLSWEVLLLHVALTEVTQVFTWKMNLSEFKMVSFLSAPLQGWLESGAQLNGLAGVPAYEPSSMVLSV